jgi:antitoxin component YwqK of YwqJK toxin-antitoxin module
MKGYKIGYIGTTKVVITLLIPNDALTNKNRNTIINPLHAKYRCNKAYVIDIVDKNDYSYEFAESGFYSKKLIYIKNKLITSDFDDDILVENGKGIHYFIDMYTAINYRVPILQQYWLDKENIYRDYYGNGQLHQEIKYTLDDNKRISYKIIQEYFPSGQVKLDYNLSINKYDGLYREWFANGKMKKRLTYKNNKVISYVEYWDIRGNKHFIYYGYI